MLKFFRAFFALFSGPSTGAGMLLHVREGAYYRCRDGAIRGPIELVRSGVAYPYGFSGTTYTEFGLAFVGKTCDLDLMSEVKMRPGPLCTKYTVLVDGVGRTWTPASLEIAEMAAQRVRASVLPATLNQLVEIQPAGSPVVLVRGCDITSIEVRLEPSGTVEDAGEVKP